jgi:homogentisate 1,2-dioxygenase
MNTITDSSVSHHVHTRGYQSGFGNEFATEALPGALPRTEFAAACALWPVCRADFGTAFTAPRGHNRRSWLYRIRPAAVHHPFEPMERGLLVSHFDDVAPPPNQLRWDPLPMPAAPTDFIEGLVTMAGNGSPQAQSGCAIHLYAANRSMTDRFFYSADGELLIVPQQGRLQLRTELGVIDIEPQEIAVIPRGVRFRCACPMARHAATSARTSARCCACPTSARSVPTAWPIRAISPRPMPGTKTAKATSADRQVRRQPVAGEDRPFAAGRGGLAWQLRAVQVRPAPLQHHRLDQLRPSRSVDLPGAAVAERYAGRGYDRLRDLPAALAGRRDTFRPPWFHRNVASEFMGLITGQYDAKEGGGFVPGGGSCTTA